ncbi:MULTISPECIES: sirohydrochlorin chelatase [Streptomyces]|uniref:sirohydrochlorin chelatase n=1 Tax=Streptomyces TaxID=1883 RepID=UPI00163B8DA9|nr:MULTISPECIES: sirohydrochlorin chelatase [Streptomyces]MBC2877526.1 sirohydrochlorin chelatase [Streptomyces sp. TYQ1024]UBI36232.1 sirohydrochlorin chelatase [Streptomyces mobaraensis]UKW28826.1 sirohydrochlorin chelatase [Streptomyces sp. TYQ1024]
MTDTPPALLLVAHGSRDPHHAATVAALRARVAARLPGVRVAAGFLDLRAPDVPTALARLAEAGVRTAVAVPLLLTHAFHASTDIPDILRTATPPGLAVQQTPVLGPSPLLLSALERRLREAGVPAHARRTTGVVLAAAGSSDPTATATVEALARTWQSTGWHSVRPAYASAAGPRTDDAVRALRADGCHRVAVARYLLAPGRLPDRIAAGAHVAGADAVAEPLGAAREVVALLVRRYEEGAVGAAGAAEAAARAAA